MAIHSNLRCPDLFAFLQIVVNQRLEMNRLQYSVSLSYEVMDPLADFVLNIEAARTSRQFVVAERMTFPPSIQTTHYMDPVLCNRLPKGRLPVRYEAVVDIDHRLDDSDQLSEVPVAVRCLALHGA